MLYPRDEMQVFRDLIKGKIAELIVKLIFEKSGLKAFWFGYEEMGADRDYRILNELDALTKAKHHKQSDLIIENREGRREYVEVKFRMRGRFCDYDGPILQGHREFYEPQIILVSCNIEVPTFQVVPPPYNVDEEGWPVDARSIMKVKKWNLSAVYVEEAERLVYKHILGDSWAAIVAVAA